jgi:hypothetical protein
MVKHKEVWQTSEPYILGKKLTWLKVSGDAELKLTLDLTFNLGERFHEMLVLRKSFRKGCPVLKVKLKGFVYGSTVECGTAIPLLILFEDPRLMVFAWAILEILNRRV